MRARIISTGTWLPPKVLDNHMLSELVDTSDTWIRERTGMSERRITSKPTWEMGTLAAKAALENSGVDPLEIDMIVGTTTTPDYYFPALSCIIQDKIGAENAFCFDLSAACSGFIFALDAVDRYIETGRVKTALIVSSEALSRLVDYKDRSTCVLFGDAAGAALIRGDHEFGVKATSLMSDGTGGGKLLNRALPPKNLYYEWEDGLYPHHPGNYMYMAGHDVYRFAVSAMKRQIEAACKSAGVTPSDIDVVVPHQANLRIIESAAARCKIPMSKVVVTIDKYANTSSSTIPVSIGEGIKRGLITAGKLVMLVGFGAGLTAGAALLRW